uniref:Metalloendopeptidase n=1 Tax=Heterorhabditis bacteriophora TaxID=37862 RepID=A0A1I7XNG4_HETBA
MYIPFFLCASDGESSAARLLLFTAMPYQVIFVFISHGISHILGTPLHLNGWFISGYILAAFIQLYNNSNMSFLIYLTVTFSTVFVVKSGNEDEAIKEKLIYRGSEDNFDNRKAVKSILEALNTINQPSRKGGMGYGRTILPPKIDLGPKNNYSSPDITEINKEINEWMFESDMALSPEQAKAILDGQNEADSGDEKSRAKRSCQTNPAAFWSPHIPINYTLDKSLSNDAVSLIRRGVRFWNQNTCLNFQENPNGMHRLRFYRGSGCWSYVGKQSKWASQDISIGDGCNSIGTITHEIGHALGFFHTQSRYDRDNAVYIDFNNIPSSLQYNFAKMTTATENHFEQPYDYGSIMQYSPYAFAQNRNKYTVIAKDTNYQNVLGQRESPAFSDIRMINWLYNCSSFCANTYPPPCRSPGYADPRNCKICKCPRTFAGDYCDQLPTGSAPNCNGAALQAPVGRKVQIRITDPPKNCMEGCPWQAVEINMGQFDLYGMIVDGCPDHLPPSAPNELTELGVIHSFRLMQYHFINLILLLLVGVEAGLFDFISNLASGGSSKKEESRQEPVSDDKAKKYLQNFGYIAPSNSLNMAPGMAADLGDAGSFLKRALLKFQEFAGLKTTGVLDMETKQKMAEPRCGVTDVLAVTSGGAAFKWRKNRLTYSIENFSPDIPKDDVRRAIREAYEVWSAVTPLEFEEVPAGSGGDIKVLESLISAANMMREKFPNVTFYDMASNRNM